MSVSDKFFGAVDVLAKIGEKLTPGDTKMTNRVATLGSDGGAHQVLEYTDFRDVTSHDTLPGQRDVLPSLKSYRLDTGERLNRIDTDTWRTLDGALTLHRAKN